MTESNHTILRNPRFLHIPCNHISKWSRILRLIILNTYLLRRTNPILHINRICPTNLLYDRFCISTIGGVLFSSSPSVPEVAYAAMLQWFNTGSLMGLTEPLSDDAPGGDEVAKLDDYWPRIITVEAIVSFNLFFACAFLSLNRNLVYVSFHGRICSWYSVLISPWILLLFIRLWRCLIMLLLSRFV